MTASKSARPQAPAMSIDEFNAFMDEVFPAAGHQAGGRRMVVEAMGYGSCTVRLVFSEKQVRPGGTISGPTMMGLSDFAIYVAVLSAVGKVPLALTTNLNINFLKAPAPRDMIARCRLIKVGKRLCVGEAELTSDGDDEMVAHATATYSIPPDRGGRPQGLSPPV
ncbi:MAG TPA: PaaI family thioesterase [Beijerinckiaceae bacterium]|nr:PaaI family thioesterase [Beijerinckiaceae bacterium]